MRWVKEDRAGGRAEREIELGEKKMRERVMETRGTRTQGKKVTGNQTFIQKQHHVFVATVSFYRDTGGGSYVEASHRVVLFRIWLRG